ncbi:MAG: hypothetical protein HQL65_03275 [Magnetococcales bacterium]|nr:hypothetical protein [Magnetococcales bacterium]
MTVGVWAGVVPPEAGMFLAAMPVAGSATLWLGTGVVPGVSVGDDVNSVPGIVA